MAMRFLKSLLACALIVSATDGPAAEKKAVPPPAVNAENYTMLKVPAVCDTKETITTALTTSGYSAVFEGTNGIERTIRVAFFMAPGLIAVVETSPSIEGKACLVISSIGTALDPSAFVNVFSDWLKVPIPQQAGDRSPWPAGPTYLRFYR